MMYWQMLKKLKETLLSIGVAFEYSKEVAVYIAKKGSVAGFGARPISRLITTEIENEITDILLKNNYENLTIIADIKNEKPNFELKYKSAVK